MSANKYELIPHRLTDEELCKIMRVEPTSKYRERFPLHEVLNPEKEIDEIKKGLKNLKEIRNEQV